MIISINGKASVGKDTFARILQFLYLQRLNIIPGAPLMSWINSDLTCQQLPIHKFADTLKEVSAFLLGISRDSFESQEFKAKKMNAIWEVFHVRYFDSVLHHDQLFTNERQAFDFYYKCLTKGLDVKEPVKELMTYRDFLIALGTNGGRENVHPNIWVYTSLAKLKAPHAILTDMRFKNELASIKGAPNVIIRIDKANMPLSNCITETDLDDCYPDFDFVINNNGSIDDLVYSAKLILDDVRLKPLFS